MKRGSVDDVQSASSISATTQQSGYRVLPIEVDIKKFVTPADTPVLTLDVVTVK